MTSPRSRALLRDAVIVILIVAGLFVAIEGAVSVFWPQKLETDYLGGPSIAVPDAQLGHRLRPNARSTVSGPEFAVSYRINQQGLRDEVHHALPRPAGTTRVLVLGDSFSYGTGSAYDAIWPTLFERAMQADGHPVEVVKAGVPSYDTRSEALYLERIFSAYDPDIVLLAFTANDLFTNRPIASGGAEREPHVSPIEGIGENKNLHSLILAKRLLMANDWLYARLYALTKRRQYFDSPPSATLRQQIEVTQTLLGRAHGFCREKGCELVVLSIPQQFQVLMADRGEALGVDVGAIDDNFAAFAEAQGFAWLATLPSLREMYHAEGQDLYFRFDGHLNAQGNRVVADYLTAAFFERFADRLRQPIAQLTGAA